LDSLPDQTIGENPSTPIPHVPNHSLNDQSAVRVGGKLEFLVPELGKSSGDEELTVWSHSNDEAKRRKEGESVKVERSTYTRV